MITLLTRVNQGKVSTAVQNEIRTFLSMYDGKTVEITLKKARSKRSTPQNRFYWGAIIPIIQQGFKDLGTLLDKDETHYFLRERYNYKEIVNENTGESVKIPQSTTTLTKSEFSEYVEKIAQFGAEFLNVIIPEAGTQQSLELINTH